MTDQKEKILKKRKLNDVRRERVAILDCGAQYGKVIDRRVRELMIESEMVSLDTPAQELSKYSALIISGGPQCLSATDAPAYDKDLFQLGLPILGICYGLQLINHVFGGTVEGKEIREDGQFDITIDKDSLLFSDLGDTTEVLLTHGDSLDVVAKGFKVSGTSKSGLVAAIENASKKIYGVQFHPEVDLTTDGKKMLKNFLYTICNLKPTYTVNNRAEMAIKLIQNTVQNNKVLALVSGGVDSSVCVALLVKALGKDNVYAVHVDNGFMRLDESKKVKVALEATGLNLSVIDAKEDFYGGRTTIDGKETERLDETIKPEIKRKIIGDTFMRVSEEKIKQFGLKLSECYLAQGTLRPDLIESASKLASCSAQVIKTHHNDTQLVRALRDAGRIIEPLKDYHKDEVRKLGLQLNLPNELVRRHPFPGPGLAIRIICCDEPFKSKDETQIISALKGFSTGNISATLLPCRTVGVQGDARSYNSLVCLSTDGDPNWDALFALAKKIPKTVHGVNRVVYAFGDHIRENVLASVTQTRLTPDVIAKLQQVDDLVTQKLLCEEHGLIEKISQIPVILFPVNFEKPGKHSICIRTLITNDFMTGLAAKPGKHISQTLLTDLANQIAKMPGIARVCYDLTSKPPATTEWE